MGISRNEFTGHDIKSRLTRDKSTFNDNYDRAFKKGRYEGMTNEDVIYIDELKKEYKDSVKLKDWVMVDEVLTRFRDKGLEAAIVDGEVLWGIIKD